MKENRINDVTKLCCEFIGYSEEDLLKYLNVRGFHSRQRQKIQYAIYHFCRSDGSNFDPSLTNNLSLTYISKYFKLSSHASLLHNIKEVNNLFDTEKDYKQKIIQMFNYIENNLYSGNISESAKIGSSNQYNLYHFKYRDIYCLHNTETLKKIYLTKSEFINLTLIQNEINRKKN